MSKLVVFKGTKDGLKIILDSQADLSAVFSALEEELARNSSFFSSGKTAVVSTSGRILESNHLIQLVEVLTANGLVLTGLVTTEGRQVSSQTDSEPQKSANSGAKVIKRTLRSGMQVKHDGDVVILGDLNPGAEVVASGDIIVFGTLRGLVHAGASGDIKAKVVALRLAPTQLRIADLIARAPDEKVSLPDRPEVARVKDGVVIIEQFAS